MISTLVVLKQNSNSPTLTTDWSQFYVGFDNIGQFVQDGTSLDYKVGVLPFDSSGIWKQHSRLLFSLDIIKLQIILYKNIFQTLCVSWITLQFRRKSLNLESSHENERDNELVKLLARLPEETKLRLPEERKKTNLSFHKRLFIFSANKHDYLIVKKSFCMKIHSANCRFENKLDSCVIHSFFKTKFSYAEFLKVRGLQKLSI